MKFYRVYVEITNVCGLSCSFCPTKSLPPKEMNLEFFDSIINQLQHNTKEIALHVVGDPLTQSNLKAYLDIVGRYKLKALLTTSGYFLKKHNDTTLFHLSVKQINFSLNSFNKNDTNFSFEQYIVPILALCQAKLDQKVESFINLRVWNLDEEESEKVFNTILFDRLSEFFDIELDIEEIYKNRPKSIRLASKIILHFDNYFEWPSLNNQIYTDGTCQGLSSHIAILADGQVVPCCLDCDGVIALGNLHRDSLETILKSKRVGDMLEGFRDNRAVEELCQKCSYRSRFDVV